MSTKLIPRDDACVLESSDGILASNIRKDDDSDSESEDDLHTSPHHNISDKRTAENNIFANL